MNRPLSSPWSGWSRSCACWRRGTPPWQSLGLFEEGTALIRACSKQLDEAEQKVVQLRKGPDGEPEELPFE